MKIMLTLIATLAVVAIIALFVLGFISSDGAAPGLVGDRLARCPDTPNCVCSEYPEDATHYIEPVSLPGDSPPAALAAARGHHRAWRQHRNRARRLSRGPLYLVAVSFRR